jgi:hypothetical protein
VPVLQSVPNAIVTCRVTASTATDGRAVAARVMLTAATTALATTATDPGYPVMTVATSLLRGRRLVAILSIQHTLEVTVSLLLTLASFPRGTADVVKLMATSTSITSQYLIWYVDPDRPTRCGSTPR